MKVLKIFTSTPLDCKKTPFLSIKIHLFLDRICCPLYDIIHYQKRGRGVKLAKICVAYSLNRSGMSKSNTQRAKKTNWL